MTTIVTPVPDADWRVEFDVGEDGDPKITLNGNDLTPAVRSFFMHWTRGGRTLLTVDFDCFPKISGYADITEVRMETKTIT